MEESATRRLSRGPFLALNFSASGASVSGRHGAGRHTPERQQRMKQAVGSTRLLVLMAIPLTLGTAWSSTARAQDAKAVYAQKCQPCHGATGKGDGAAGKFLRPHPPRDFAASLKGKSDYWIAKTIKDGGPAVGKSSVMPGYKDLTDDQAKALVEYIKQLGSQHRTRGE